MRRFLDSRRLSKRAQMPFSLAAVILLILSGATISLVASIENGEKKGPMDADTIRGMNEVALRASQHIEELAYSAAVDVVKEHPFANESHLNFLFMECIAERFEREYPDHIGPFQIAVNKSNLILLYLRASIDDLYPSDASGVCNWSSCTVPAYFSLYGNFTVTVTGKGGQLNKETGLDGGIYYPAPLLANRLEEFSNAVAGNNSHLERLVCYELSALVQDRILRGYGAGSAADQLGTSSILTEDDIIRAIALALLLEEKSILRCIDSGLIESELSTEVANDIVTRVRNLNGSIDPAKLFLSTYDEGAYDFGMVISQCLYASADIITLRWLEYLGVLPTLTQGLEDSAERLTFQFADVLNAIMNRDLVNESAVDWIRKTMANAGYSEMFYRYVHYSSPDIIVSIPKFDLVLLNERSEVVTVGLSGTYTLDLPSLDLLASDEWKAFALEYIQSSYELANSIRSFIKSISLAVGQSSSLPQLNVDLDPTRGDGFAIEIRKAIESALRANWYGSAVEQAKRTILVQDKMSAALLEFLHSHWKELFELDESMRLVCNQIAQSLVDKYIKSRGDFGPNSIENALNSIYLYLYCETNSGGGKAIVDSFYESISLTIGRFEKAFGEASFENSSMVGTISKLASGLITSLPGIREIGSGLAIKMVSDMETSSSLGGDEVIVFLSPDESFSLLSFGSKLNEKLSIDTDLEQEGSSVPLRIFIRDPSELKLEESSNRHFVERGNLTLCPFSSEWRIEVSGSLRMKLSTPTSSNEKVPGPMAIESEVPLSMSFALCGFSGWPLEGVDYLPSTSLSKDVQLVVEDLIRAVSQGMRSVCKGMSDASAMIQQLKSFFSTYALVPLEAASSAFLTILESTQGFFSDSVYVLLQGLADFLKTQGQRVIRTELFGLQLALYINPEDIAFGRSVDVLRFDVADSGNSASLRLLRLPDGSTTALFNSTIGGDNWRASAIIDPWMKVREHMVEVTGVVQGAVFELYLPEVVNYRSITVSLSDIPLLGDILGRIPSPLPGTTLSVDAGFELRCDSPLTDQVLINELEQNPAGEDSGREWIELYNPTSVPVNLFGWSIKTSHGEQRVEKVDQVIMPSSFLVLVFDGQALDNGDPEKFPLEERIALCDDKGMVVDSAPWVADYYNDRRTWQREVDGGSDWEFRNETRGERNGPFSIPVDLSSLRTMILDAAETAISRMELIPSLEFVIDFIERTISNILEFLLNVIERSMIELNLFVDLGLRDGLGVLGAGVRAGLKVEGEVIAGGLKWILESAQSLVLDPSNPSNHARASGFLEDLRTGAYVWLSVYGGAQLPKCLGKAVPSASFRCSAVIELNLACLSWIVGGGKEHWRMNGGVVISGLPAGLVGNPLTSPGECTDIWLFKASIYSPAM